MKRDDLWLKVKGYKPSLRGAPFHMHPEKAAAFGNRITDFSHFARIPDNSLWKNIFKSKRIKKKMCFKKFTAATGEGSKHGLLGRNLNGSGPWWVSQPSGGEGLRLTWGSSPQLQVTPGPLSGTGT